MKLLLLALLVLLVDSVKVSDRWMKYYERGARCRLLVPSPTARPGVSATNFDNFDKIVVKFWKKSNCSLAWTAFTKPGTANASGQYDGVIGKIQRDEYDMSPLMVRTDALASQPIKHAAAFQASEFVIITGYNRPISVDRELVSFIATFPFLFYVYFTATMFIMVSIFTYIAASRGVGRLNFDLINGMTFIREMKTVAFNSIAYVLRQTARFELTDYTTMVLFTAFAVFVFSVSNYWLNQVGSDLKADRPVAQVDSVETLLNKPELKVHYAQIFHLTELMESSPAGNPLNRLWNRIKDHLDEAILDKDPLAFEKNYANLQSSAAKLNSGQIAIILPRMVVQFQKMVSCLVDKYKVTTYVSEGFGHGVDTCIFSHNIHPYVERFVNYYITTLAETGFMKSQAVKFPDTVANFYGFRLNHKHYQCMDEAFGRVKQSTLFEPFGLATMGSLFLILIAVYLIAGVVLVFEVLSKVKKRRRINLTVHTVTRGRHSRK